MTSTNNKQLVTPSAKMNNRSIVEKQEKPRTHDEFLEPRVPSVCTSEMYGPLFSIQYLWLSSTSSRKMDTLKVAKPEFHLMCN